MHGTGCLDRLQLEEPRASHQDDVHEQPLKTRGTAEYLNGETNSTFEGEVMFFRKTDKNDRYLSSLSHLSSDWLERSAVGKTRAGKATASDPAPAAVTEMSPVQTAVRIADRRGIPGGGTSFFH